MKKFFVFFLSTMFFVGCSQDDEIIEPKSELVDAVINVDMRQPAKSRSFLGVINGETVPHLFESNDKIKLIDKFGQYTFIINTDGQSTTMRGKWGDPDKYPNCFALHPFEAARGTNPVEVDESNYPTMHFTLPTTQESRDLAQTSQSKDSGISYQKDAGLAFSCESNKEYDFIFIPVVSFLYFYSENPNCTIESDDFIAGDYAVKYKATKGTNVNDETYSTPEGLWSNNRLAISATSTTINCIGKEIEVHKDKYNGKKYYEYIVALKPGTYTANNIRIKQSGKTKYFANKQGVTFIPSYLYYIGCIDVAQ